MDEKKPVPASKEKKSLTPSKEGVKDEKRAPSTSKTIDEKTKQTTYVTKKLSEADFCKSQAALMYGIGAVLDEKKNLVLVAINNFVSTTTTLGVQGLRAQFSALKSYQSSTFSHPSYTANPKKNRYQDIVCLEDTRVKLKTDNPGDSDYIHANWVQLEGHNKKYIATQGPIEETIQDFWRMCWEADVCFIVQLCRLVEGNKIKCAAYWPQKEGDYKTIGSFFVYNKKVETEEKFTVCTIELLPEGCSDSRIIKLIQFPNWPDRGVPLSGRMLLRFLRLMANTDVLATGHTVVHCSAGVGRTGTIILIDWLLGQVFQGVNVDVPTLFRTLRNQRAGAIHTEEQYLFVHTTVMDYIAAKMPKYKDQVAAFHEEVKKSLKNK